MYLLALGALFYLPWLGRAPLFDWDEINFAECSREMLLSGEYLRVQLDFKPFWEKPPLFFWLQALSMRVFGVNEYAARLPNALIGLLTLLLLYNIGKKLHDARFGFFWSLAWLGALLPHLYAKSGIIDPLFNLLIFTSLYLLMQRPGVAAGWKRLLWPTLAGLLLGLAALAKGPVALLIAGLVTGLFLLFSRFRRGPGVGALVLYGFSALLAAGFWFGLEYMARGPWFIAEFLKYQWRLFSTPDAGHGGFPGYHVVVLLLGCFPASGLALGALLKPAGGATENQRDTHRWMAILFWVVLTLFSIVQSKIVHYSSLCYFPLTYFAAISLTRWAEKGRPDALTKYVTVIIGVLLGLVAALAPFVLRDPSWLEPYIRDPYGKASLRAEVLWQGWEMLPGIWMLLLLVLVFGALRRKAIPAVTLLFIGTAVFLTAALGAFLGKAGQYSQQAAVDFYRQHQGECVENAGFKTYAHLFYTRRLPDSCPPREAWRQQSPERPYYVVSKIHKAGPLHESLRLKFLYERNGYVFFEVMPQPATP